MSSERDKRLSRIERLLLANPQGLRLSDIAGRLRINRSTGLRDIIALEHQGVLLWESDDGRYGIFDQKSSTRFDEPVDKLGALLRAETREEAVYQALFQEYPWMLGHYYKEIRRHQKLDDENVPDFVGIRSSDNVMDIFEIKQPFLKVMQDNGKFTGDFNDSWNQAERYRNSGNPGFYYRA